MPQQFHWDYEAFCPLKIRYGTLVQSIKQSPSPKPSYDRLRTGSLQRIEGGIQFKGFQKTRKPTTASLTSSDSHGIAQQKHQIREPLFVMSHQPQDSPIGGN